MPEADIKPYFGSYLEAAVEQFTPALFRRSVHCDLLTIDEAGTVRGKVVADYGETQAIPGIPNPLGGWLRDPQTWTLWEASVVVHWKSYFSNFLTTDYIVDVGAIHGAIDTAALRTGVIDVLRGHSQDIGSHRPQTSRSSITVTFTNDAPYGVDFYLNGSGSLSTPLRLEPGHSQGYNLVLATGFNPYIHIRQPDTTFRDTILPIKDQRYRLQRTPQNQVKLVPE